MNHIKVIIGKSEDCVSALVELRENSLREEETEWLVVLPPMVGSNRDGGSITEAELNEAIEGWSNLAQKLQSYLIPGSFLVEQSSNKGFLHQAPLLDKTGKLLGKCCQTHLSNQEAAGGWLGSPILPVVNTSFGKLAILLNRDCWQPEVWRLATLAGAKVVVALTMVEGTYTESLQLAGSWQNVQQNQVFGVECSLLGSWNGKSYQGRNAIMGPCELTADFSGFMPIKEESDFLMGELFISKLNQIREDYPLLKQLKYSLYENELLPLYRQYALGVDK